MPLRLALPSSFVRRLFQFMDLYVIGLLVLVLARLLIGDRWTIIALGSSFLPLLLLTGCLCLPVVILRRQWKLTAVSVVPVLFFFASYGGQFIPNTISIPTNAPTFKLITYNIHAEQLVLEPMVALIRDVDADIVALQEVSTTAADIFTAELSAIYPYRAFHTNPDAPSAGQGVLSKYPLTSDDYWQNTQLPVYLAHQQSSVDLNGQSVTIFNTHPMHPFVKAGYLFNDDLRSIELQSVLDRAAQITEPVIIAGDFNMPDQSDDYQRITATYTDAYREAGWWMGFTFPDFLHQNATPGKLLPLPVRPLARIDYIFHSDHLQATSAQVWRTSGGSDHRPVIATLALLEE